MEEQSGDPTAVKKKFTFLWIDDDPTRKEFIDSLSSHRKFGYIAKVDFVNLENRNVVTEIPIILKRKPPNLIIIDHVFNRTAKANIIKEGSTIAELIKEKWPSRPIVCVTGVRKSRDINLNKKSSYEDVFTDHELHEHYDSMFILAHSFKQLLMKRNKSASQLINLLLPPKDDVDRLNLSMSQDIKIVDDGQLIRFFRWMHNELFSNPGFLYNKLWTATFVGVKEASFHKVEDIFKEAQYRGVFADYDGPRWWATKLKEIIYRKVPSLGPSSTRELGRKLRHLSKKDYSMCYVCGKSYPPPETVGYPDVQSEEAKPLHLECTIPHPRFPKRLYFEEIRMIKPRR